jgi:hypothetical protein
MDVCVGDELLVNAAAFIASRFPNRESIPCDVLVCRQSSPTRVDRPKSSVPTTQVSWSTSRDLIR